MLPILLIHGYSSDGDDNSVEQIYGSLPQDLRDEFGANNVLNLNLSRWISLSDGIALDDVSFAMERALKSLAPRLDDGFHVVIHSTGALVVRNWIRLFSPKPCPIQNLVHLAGANFGSGLAHIGRGQLARWGRLLQGTGRGVKILDELEFGSWKTIDLHRHFLAPENDIYRDYQVQEFCLIGSQTLAALRAVPIRYVKEDSSDNTVRTSAGNLNFNYISVTPAPDTYQLTVRKLRQIVDTRLNNETVSTDHYQTDLSLCSDARPPVPYSIVFETAHFGEEIGIVNGTDNRKDVVPLTVKALATPYDADAYAAVADDFETARQKTFDRAAKLKSSLFEWNKQAQYEGHAQLIFRLRDQFGHQIKDFDITFRSTPPGTKKNKLEYMIQDKHLNKVNPGTITFYLRTQSFDEKSKTFVDLLEDVPSLQLEVTAHEDKSDDIDFVPLNLKLTPTQIRAAIQTFRTTIVDITLLRLPSQKVFAIKS